MAVYLSKMAATMVGTTNYGEETETQMVWPHLKILCSQRSKKERNTEEMGRHIREWTGKRFGDSLRAEEYGERWKGIVATSSVVHPIYEAEAERKCKERKARTKGSASESSFSELTCSFCNRLTVYSKHWTYQHT